jgi:L,D-transpeptidase-like protein
MHFGLEPRLRSLLSCLPLLASFACSNGCDSKAPPSPPASESNPVPPSELPAPAVSDAGAGSEPLDSTPTSLTDAGAAAVHYTGPYFTVTAGSAGIYNAPSADRSGKLGYARAGGRVPVLPGTVAGENCKAGWYRLLDGGFICGAEGSTDASDPRVRLAMRAPDLAGVLPYPYARNAQNGTPLYSSVPSRDQIAAYEPYLEPADAPRPAVPGGLAWWRRKEAALSEVRLAELADESDGVIARRMVKGFYVAVDTEFEWSDRSWYKTTKGMIAPKDRFVPVEGYTFRGIDLDPEHTLPVAWVYGSRDNRPTYLIDDNGKVKPSGGVVDRLVPIHLQGDPVKAEGHEYVHSTAGFWLRSDQVRVARTPPVPANVQEHEHWIHVDLYTQTLVAMSGSTPVYATLISSGRESEEEDKDHRTPPGEWTIREKHVTNTMDGDGTAAGDLPYSIEDVPYVMYFKGSYALHGAFWHRNFGMRMSHGCINLAPLDAKYLFFFTGPSVREGWHGAWAGNGQAGSRVVIDGPVRGSTARP